MDENEFWLEFFQMLACGMEFTAAATTKHMKDHIEKCSEFADIATAEAVRKGRLGFTHN